MSNQPQASVRKSTAWTLPAGSLSAMGEPLPPSTRSMLPQERPRNCCVCVCQWPWCHLHSSPSPAPPVRGHPHQQQTLGQWIDSMFRLCGGFLSIQMTVRTSVFYTTIPFCKLEASNWDDSAEQKWVRVMTSEVFLGQKYWLWVSCLTVLWETSKEHHSQFGVFKEGSSPQRGRSLQSVLAFIKTLCTLGKLIEVRKRREKDKKANALAKQGKKDVPLSV